MTWKDFGIGVAGVGAKGLIDTGLGQFNSWTNYLYGEKSADNAAKRQKELYNELHSPAAMLKQYREAGLSPSLMFSNGAGGAGGMSAPQGTGALGTSINSGPIDMTQAAQVENIKADTDLKNAQKGLLSQQEIAQELNNYIQSQTIGANIYRTYLELNVMTAELEKTISETTGIDWQNAFNKATENTQIQMLVNKNANLLKDLLVKDSQIKLNEEQSKHFNTIAEKWQMDVYQKWVELDYHKESIENQKQWFDDQVENFITQLEQDKEIKMSQLKQQKTQMWINLGTDLLKTVVYGGTLYATGGLSAFTKPPQIGFR